MRIFYILIITGLMLEGVSLFGQETIKASQFGFDKVDATKCLQAAINSGAKTVVVDNTGSDWIIEPIKLVSSQEVVFAKGVRLVAKRGAYKGMDDRMFSARNKKDITIRGEGDVVLRMWKQDYQDKAQYKQGEWRHCLDFRGVENLKVSNLTLQASGGDGIALGRGGSENACVNVVLENILSEDQHRLALAVVSAKNLTVRNCVFRNTTGTPPMAGIDFEPNHPDEKLVNITVEHCSFSGNHGRGIVIAPTALNGQSAPISITVRNCTFSNNSINLCVMLPAFRKADTKELAGRIEFADCALAAPKQSPNLALYDIPYKNGVKVMVRDLKIDNQHGCTEAIQILANCSVGRPIGGITFQNVTVVDDNPERETVIFKNLSGTTLAELKGSLQLLRDGKIEDVPLADIVKKAKRDNAPFEDFAIAENPALNTLQPLPSSPVEIKPGALPVRNRGTFLQWAAQGQTVKLQGKCSQAITVPSSTVTIVAPDGKSVKKVEITSDKQFADFEFNAPETGIYTLKCDMRGNVLELLSTNSGGWLVDGSLALYIPNGNFYFLVPAGVRKFVVMINGQSGEFVSASLIDPQGKAVLTHKHFDTAKAFTFTRPANAPDEVWSIELYNVTEDVSVRFGAPLLPVVGSHPNLLKVETNSK